jgi:predicted lipid-binding transport protein (Tim44 family)
MRRNSIICAILALFLTSLVVTAVAEARAGGGFSGGSRGSRSYSAPRSPSAPASPSSPTSPQRGFSSPTQPQRPGFGFGGMGGMIGGFLLGGLLGGLLFGGLGHGFGGLGGIGLMDILLIAGIGYLAFAFFRRRQPQPAYAGAPGRSEWAPTETAMPERPMAMGSAAGPAVGPTVGSVDEDLDRGIAAIRTMDAGFTPVRFAEISRTIFLRVQSAWTARDLGPVRADLTEEMAGSLETDLARLKTLRRVNKLDKLSVESAEVTEAWQEYGNDFVTVRFRASVLDYTLDETTGAVVEGSNTLPTGFDEYWTFVRSVGPNPWRLSAIQQPS